MRLLFPIALVLLAVAVGLRSLLSADAIPLYRDSLFFFVPLRHHLWSAYGAGELPFWNPWIYLGAPFLGSLQSSVLYPPSAIFLLEPFPLAFNASILTHFVIAVAGATLWLRERKLGPIPIAVGVLVFALGGYLVSTINLLNHLQGAAWTPWLLWAIRRVQQRARPSDLATLGVIAALQLLAGAPEALLLSAVAGIALELELRNPRTSFRTGALLAGAAILAVGLCAFQLPATLTALADSSRASALRFEEVHRWSLEPVALLHLLFAKSATLGGPDEALHLARGLESKPPWIQTSYVGLLPLCAIVAGACVATLQSARLLLLAAIGIVLALGVHTPIVPALYESIPIVFARFRYPEKFLLLVHVAAALLAAVGVQALLDRKSAALRGGGAALAVFASIFVALRLLAEWSPVSVLNLVVILRPDPSPRALYAGLATDLVFVAERGIWILGVGAGLTALYYRRLVSAGLFGYALLAIAAADLVAAHHGLNLTVSWRELQAAVDPALVAPLRENRSRVFHYTLEANDVGQSGKLVAVPGLARWEDPIGRPTSLRDITVDRWRLLFLNVPGVFGARSISGGDGIARRSDLELSAVLPNLPKAGAIALLRNLGGSRLIGSGPLQSDRLADESRSPLGVWFYRIREPVPFVRSVADLRIVESEGQALATLAAPSFDVSRTAVLHRWPEGWDRSAARVGSAKVERLSANSIEIAVDGSGPHLLVVGDGAAPGWRAWVDGQAAPILRADAYFRGIALPSGRHDVVMRYEPPGFRVGLWVSVASLLLAGGLITAGRMRRRGS